MPEFKTELCQKLLLFVIDVSKIRAENIEPLPLT